MDQCKNCISRGDFDKCQKTPCYHHELWMVNNLHSKINRTIPTEDIVLIHELLRSASFALIDTHHTLSSDLNIAFVKLEQFIPEKSNDQPTD